MEEVNQEGSKEEKHRDVGKEVESIDDAAVISRFDEFLANPEIFTSVLSAPNMQKHLSELQKEGVLSQNPSPKSPIIEKDISTLNELLTPEVLRCIHRAPRMQGQLLFQQSSPIVHQPRPVKSLTFTTPPPPPPPPTTTEPVVTRSAPSKQNPPALSTKNMDDLIEFLRNYQAFPPTKAKLPSPSKPKYSTPPTPIGKLSFSPAVSDYSTPKSPSSESSTRYSTPESTSTESSSRYSTPDHPNYPSRTTTPTSRQSISTATPTPTPSVPSTPTVHPIIASTTTPASGLRISTSDDGGEDDERKQIQEQISKEVKLEFLMYALKELPNLTLRKKLFKRIPEVKSQKELLKQTTDVKERRELLKEIPEVRLQKGLLKLKRRLRRQVAKAWKELVISKQDKRWSIQVEFANLFNAVLKICYPELKEETCTILPCVEKFGDYNCENVLTIWPALREKGTTHRGGPRRVGWRIKRTLELLQPDMLEREPWVVDVGFVCIKLSGKWMAKGVHKMLNDGVDTWAPEFFIERVLVNFPSFDAADLMPMDLLRRGLITTTLVNMLKYSKIPVEFSTPPQESPIEERGDGLLIFRNDGEEREIHFKRVGGCSGNPVKDLTDLWYGLEKKKVDWLVCVAPVHQQENIKMCIKAAQHANWLPPHWSDPPRASFTGFQTCKAEVKPEELDSLLKKAEVQCSEAAKKLGYTSEQVQNCVLKYTILKNDRLADYTFEEMLNEEGNTFVYLLNTLARIRLFTEKYREDITKLKKASELELELEKGEIWKQGVERVLVHHLLRFTKVIADSCLTVFPHILCEFLYDLSKNFNRFLDESAELVSVAEETELLLCEATRVVMKKGFQLLGITPESSSLGEGWQASSSLLPIQRLNHMNPPKINTRFELLSFYPHITRDPDFKEGRMFGQISVSDSYNLRSDGWVLSSFPDHGFVPIFNREWHDSIDITNHRTVDVGNPRSRCLIPFSSLMEVRVELYASTEENDALFEISNHLFEIDCEEFLEDENDTRRSIYSSIGEDGLIRMYYVLLKNAVDCAIKVTFLPKKDGGEVFAEVFAHYGGSFFGEETDPFEKNYYTATLFQDSFSPEIGEIPLERSRLAVPGKGSIVIVARLCYVDSVDMILDERFMFDAPPEDTPHGYNDEERIFESGTLRVKVDWSRGL